MSNPTELPDLDKLEAYATSSKSGDWHATEAMLNMLDEDNILALIALARRAQPEGEAPQADDENIEADAYMAACDEMERWQKKRAKARLEIGTEGSLVDGIGWLYGHIEKLEGAATLSPLCGAQHAESGKEEMADRIRKLEAIVLGSCDDLGALHNAFGFDPADPIDTDRMICWVSDWRAQQAATTGADEVTDTQRLDMIGAIVDEQGFLYLHHNRPRGLGLGTSAENLREDLDGLMRRRAATAKRQARAAQLDGGQEGSESNG